MIETIILHDIGGITRKTGIDDYGNHWTQFEVDDLAEQEDGECFICGAILDSGWLCLDGGDELCDYHMDFPPQA